MGGAHAAIAGRIRSVNISTLSLAGIDSRTLTPYFREFLRCLGAEPTLRLIRAFGGTRVVLPALVNEFDDDLELLQALSRDEVNQLIRSWAMPSSRPVVPKADKLFARVRDVAICADPRDNATVALAYGVSERWVQVIRARFRDNTEYRTAQKRLADARQIEMEI